MPFFYMFFKIEKVCRGWGQAKSVQKNFPVMPKVEIIERMYSNILLSDCLLHF